MPARGFTLIELLVAIAIIGVVAGVVIPQFSTFNKTQNTSNVSQNVLNKIKQTQNYAVSGTKCTSTVPATSWEMQFLSNGTHFRIQPTCNTLDNSANSPPIRALQAVCTSAGGWKIDFSWYPVADAQRYLIRINNQNYDKATGDMSWNTGANGDYYSDFIHPTQGADGKVHFILDNSKSANTFAGNFNWWLHATVRPDDVSWNGGAEDPMVGQTYTAGPNFSCEGSAVNDDASTIAVIPTPTPESIGQTINVEKVLLDGCSDTDLKSYNPTIIFKGINGDISFKLDSNSSCTPTAINSSKEMKIFLRSGATVNSSDPVIVVKKGGSFGIVSNEEAS